MLPTKSKLIIAGIVAICAAAFSFSEKQATTYYTRYAEQLQAFTNSQQKLLQVIEQSDLQQASAVDQIKTQLQITRDQLKGLDFWFRYLEPTGPEDTAFARLSPDNGRYEINPATETKNAFRTGTIRNAAHTAPYMHNGVFTSLSQVIDFYDNGGGVGRQLPINNQTLSADPLQLTVEEKSNLLHFISSLNEDIVFETAPQQLPFPKKRLIPGSPEENIKTTPMQYKLIILASVWLLAACVVQQQAVTYSFPEAMAEPVRLEFTRICDKGKILYDLNCAGCHTIKKGKRQIIPDFTPEQLKGYELRVSNAKHEENMPDERVTAEELSLISTFLLYKTRNKTGR